MLVLTRTLGEAICIGDNIRVVVSKIERGEVRLGIEAPGIKIYREEIYKEIQKAKESGEDAGPLK